VTARTKGNQNEIKPDGTTMTPDGNRPKGFRQRVLLAPLKSPPLPRSPQISMVPTTLDAFKAGPFFMTWGGPTSRGQKGYWLKKICSPEKGCSLEKGCWLEKGYWLEKGCHQRNKIKK